MRKPAVWLWGKNTGWRNSKYKGSEDLAHAGKSEKITETGQGGHGERELEEEAGVVAGLYGFSGLGVLSVRTDVL